MKNVINNGARLLDLAINDYHGDKVADVPTLSPSQANTLIQKSPSHLWLEHPRLGNQPRPISNEKQKKMDEGTLIHKMVLGAGKEYQVIMGFDDYKKMEARELRDEIRARGMVPILESAFDECVRVAESIKEKLNIRGVNLRGKSEMMMAYFEAADGDDVLCRMMPDHFVQEDAEIYEVKIIFCAHPDACSRQIVNMGYDIQMFAYLNGVAALHPELAGRLKFYWIFAEAEPPYSVTIGQPTGMMIKHGQMRWSKAVNLWNECLKSNHWPDYSEGVIDIDPPQWSMKNEMEESFYG